MDVSQLVLQGGVYLTGPALHELMAREVPVTWLSHGGWFLGHTVGLGHKNVELRTAQYRASFDAAHCLRLAKDIVAAKIRNQRTLLRRNWKRGEPPGELLAAFRHDIDAAERARDIAQLLGIEGNAAARYFRHFGQMLSLPDDSAASMGLRLRTPHAPAAHRPRQRAAVVRLFAADAQHGRDAHAPWASTPTEASTTSRATAGRRWRWT